MTWRFDRHPAIGLTLVEVLIALAILALAAAIVIPNVRGPQDSVSLEGTARKIAAHLREARARAIGRNEERVLTIDLEARTYGDTATDSRAGIAETIDIDVVAARSEYAGPSEPAIRFWPDGSATGGTVRLARGGRAFEITVDWLTGSVSFAEADTDD